MSKQEEWDEWGLSSGLPLADAEVEVVGMEFGFNNDIAAGKTFANFTFRTEDGEEHEQSFSVGDGWESKNKGAELGTENGKPKKLSQRSNYGMLVQSAMDAVGGPEGMAKLGQGFRFAATWVGTKWLTATKEVESTKPGETEAKKRDRIIFAEYLGRDSEAEAPVKGKGKAAAAGPASDVDPELWAELITLAKASDGHDGFMDEALELDGVAGNKAMEKVVMSTKAGSVWATAKAE
jgi:hypothetical protein